MIAPMSPPIGMITARPSSLRHYAEVGEAIADDVERAGAQVGAALDAARAGAIDVPVQVPDAGGLMRDLARLVGDTGATVQQAAQAFEDADRSGADLLRARDAQVEARLPEASAWDQWLATATTVLAHPAARGAILGAGVARLSQMWRAAGRFVDAWIERAFTRLFYRALGGVAALPYRMVFRFSRAREVAGSVRSWGDPAVQRATARMGDAARVFRHGQGVVRTVGRVAAPLAAFGDATTLFGGSRYEGARGTADRVMAGVGLVGAGALALTATPLAPIAAPVALVAGTAAVAWGVGNLVADNWDSITDGVSSVASAVTGGGRRIVAAVTSPISGGVSAVGRVFGFGG